MAFCKKFCPEENGTAPNMALKYDKTERIFNLEYRKNKKIRQSTLCAMPGKRKVARRAGTEISGIQPPASDHDGGSTGIFEGL